MAATALLAPPNPHTSHLLLTPGERLLQPQFPTPASSSRKRKRDEEKLFLGEAFTIEPHGSSVFDSNVKIAPVSLLPRNCVPLAWATSGFTSRLFSANIPVLEAPGNILIAKYDNDRQLAAVERLRDGVYTLYRLSTQVRMKDIRKLSAQIKKTPPKLGMTCASTFDFASNGSAQWWEVLSECLEGLGSMALSRGEAAQHTQSRLSSILKAKKPELLPAKTKVPDTPQTLLEHPVDIAPVEATTQTPDDILGNIRKQYYEILYITKSSLAYFAKSTLSRARVEFQIDNKSPKSRVDLVKYLRNMIAPIDKNDKKFRSTLSRLAKGDVKDVDDSFSDGELDYAKRWVEGIVGEEEYLVKTTEHMDQMLRKKIAELRTRETELQIILLLEIIAIKAKLPEDKLKELALETGKTKKGRKRKQAKAKDAISPEPQVLLDLLVDRLCIWQSIGSEDPLGEKKEEEKASKQKNDQDHLRHFSVEIVMAFYSSRLPEECASIKRKCAGKTAVPRPSRETAKAVSKITNGTLQAEETQQALTPQETTKRPISLPRSNTAPAILAESQLTESIIEAESQDVSSKQESQKKAGRGGLIGSKSFDKRVVEVQRGLKTTDPEKKAKIDEQLKIAIRNISKPQRINAMEEVISRNTTVMRAGGRKSKKPVFNPMANVEVAATPAKNRKRAYQKFKRQPIIEEDEDSPEQPRAHASSKRSRVDIFDEGLISTPTKLPRSERHKSALLPSIHRPNLGGAPSSPFVIPNSTPLRSHSDTALLGRKGNFTIENTPTKARPCLGKAELWSDNGLIAETPVKQTPGTRFDKEDALGGVFLSLAKFDTLPSTPLPSSRKTAAKALAEKVHDDNDNDDVGGVSIYDALGWD